MGIHLLPVTPAITYMGYDKNTVTSIWNQYERIQVAYQKKIEKEGAVDPEGWYHILWPFMALSDADGAAWRWGQEYSSHINAEGNYVDGVLSTDEMFNSYWYIQNMCAKGDIQTDVWASDYTSYQIFKKNGAYTAEVWNPFDREITVHFANKNGALGSVKVAAHATVDSDPMRNEDKTVDANGNKIKYVPVKNYDPVNKISGVVEAEDYYTNFSCEPAEDANEGGYVGWIDDGDSLVYTVDVKEDADYVVEYRVQCVDQNKNSAIKLKTDNDNGYILTTQLGNATTDWKNVKANNTIHLKAGQYKMKLLFVDGGFNINYVKIYKKGTKAPVAASDDVTKADLSSYPEISLNNAKVIDVSSVSNDQNTGDKMIDKNYESRWESQASDPQFFTIELAQEQQIGGIKLYWEGAASKKYEIQTSTDNRNWTTVFTQTKGLGGRENGDENRSSGLEAISFDKVTTAKYVRLYSTERLTGYGVSLYEVRLYGPGEYTEPPTDPEQPTDPGESGDVATGNVAEGKNAVASGQEGDNVAPKFAVDGNKGTRWSSKFEDASWMYVDLGKTYSVNKVVLTWENAYGKDYEIQVSTDGNNWKTVKTMKDQDGGEDVIEFNAVNARYVKMNGLKRATGYGYSLWEFEVYTGKAGGETPTNPTEPSDPSVSGQDVALGKTTQQSGAEADAMGADKTVDGDMGTRWSSNFNDDAWMFVDLGKAYEINKVVITWENAYGKDYDIQVSTDGNNWTTVKQLRDQDGGEDVITFNAVKAKYVKMQGVKRAMGYGYSMWDFKVIAK